MVLSKASPLVSCPLSCFISKLRLQTWSPPSWNATSLSSIFPRKFRSGESSRSLQLPPRQLLHTNCFGVIPKRGRPRKWWLIEDLSFPYGGIGKDGIDGNDFPLSYTRLDDAIDFIKQEGRGTLLAKADIRDTHRLISVSSECPGTTRCTSALPFGLRSAPLHIQSICWSLALDSPPKTRHTISPTLTGWLFNSRCS